MRRFMFIFSVLLLGLATTGAYSQSWLEKVGKKAVKRAEKRSKDKVNKTVDKTVDDAFDQTEGVVKGKEDPAKSSGKDTSLSPGKKSQEKKRNISDEKVTLSDKPLRKADEASGKKFDFVAGGEILFDDQLAGEIPGEFPSQWDLLGGNAEIASINGQNVIAFLENTELTPFMKTPKNYLSENFTIELDFYVPEKIDGCWEFHLKMPDKEDDVAVIAWGTEAEENRSVQTRWRTISDEWRTSGVNIDLSRVGWHRLSVSFNRRTLKVYIDQERVMNIPHVDQAGWFTASSVSNTKTGYYLREIRMAKGTVSLYERIMAEGSFVTYGIAFDVGTSTIKSESMGEINRIVKLMAEHPDLKFSVEGHTDSTGDASSNQILSESRSKAIVTKLIEMGISADRLTPVGKGQTFPIADNGTDQGRAKNRRVEFVKR